MESSLRKSRAVEKFFPVGPRKLIRPWCVRLREGAKERGREGGRGERREGERADFISVTARCVSKPRSHNFRPLFHTHIHTDRARLFANNRVKVAASSECGVMSG